MNERVKVCVRVGEWAAFRVAQGERVAEIFPPSFIEM